MVMLGLPPSSWVGLSAARPYLAVFPIWQQAPLDQEVHHAGPEKQAWIPISQVDLNCASENKAEVKAGMPPGVDGAPAAVRRQALVRAKLTHAPCPRLAHPSY